MKRILIAGLAGLALSASAAHTMPRNVPPAPIHIAFGDCAAFGTSDITNPCNSNAGAIVIVGSFSPPVTVSDAVGIEALVDASQAAVLSDWWRVDPAGCRAGRMVPGFLFPDPQNCWDSFASTGLGGLSIIYPGTALGLIPSQSERFDVYQAVDANYPVQFTAGQETYLFNLFIYKTRTVGGCGGCDVPTRLCISELDIARVPGAGSLDYSSDGSYQCLTYNTSSPTPARVSTWGAIKSLYR
jgi:hypothetical protein